MISLGKDAPDVLSSIGGLRNCSTPAECPPNLTSSPHLWTKFQRKVATLTLQNLARSASLPIDVTAGPHSDIQAVTALSSATDRLRSLTLELRPLDLEQVFRELSNPAPVLEHLEVSIADDAGEGFCPSIPKTFLGGSTPALKSLHLNKINTWLNFSQFPALTHLTITAPALGLDIWELFQVFKSAKLLEEVSVEFTGPTVTILESDTTVQPLEMRELKKLNFSNTSREFPEHLLPFLLMPSVEEVELRISLSRWDARTIQGFLPPLLRGTPHLLRVDSLELDVSYDHCNIRLGGCGVSVSICASRGKDRGEYGGFLSHWLDSLEPMSIADIKNLTLLYYCPKEPLGECPVLKLLRTMEGVRSLVVERCNANTIKTLYPFESEGESILFPSLESLTFQRIVTPTIFPDLTHMAQARSDAGFRLNRVSSDQYTYFRRSDVDSLQLHVNHVQLNMRADSHIEAPTRILAPPPMMTDSSQAPADHLSGGPMGTAKAFRNSLQYTPEDGAPRSSPPLPYI